MQSNLCNNLYQFCNPTIFQFQFTSNSTLKLYKIVTTMAKKILADCQDRNRIKYLQKISGLYGVLFTFSNGMFLQANQQSRTIHTNRVLPTCNELFVKQGCSCLLDANFEFLAFSVSYGIVVRDIMIYSS